MTDEITNNTPLSREDGTYLEDRSTLTMRAMEKYAGKPQKGLDKLDISYDINRKTKLCLVMCPEWDGKGCWNV